MYLLFRNEPARSSYKQCRKFSKFFSSFEEGNETSIVSVLCLDVLMSCVVETSFEAREMTSTLSVVCINVFTFCVVDTFAPIDATSLESNTARRVVLTPLEGVC